MPRKQSRAAETARRPVAAELIQRGRENPPGAAAPYAVSMPLNWARNAVRPGTWRDGLTPEPGVGRRPPR